MTVILFTLLWLCGSVVTYSHHCLNEEDRLVWNRSLHFENQHLRLKVASSDDVGHRIVNEIFRILAEERLGYAEVDFISEESTSTADVINYLKCRNESCTELPHIHLHLSVWFKGGVDVRSWADPSAITVHGPLGPTHHWQLVSMGNIEHQTDSWQEFSAETWNVPASCLVDQLEVPFRRSFAAPVRPKASTQITGPPIGVLQFYISSSSSSVHSRSTIWSPASLCEGLSEPSGSNSSPVCLAEPYQAVKLSWVKLAKISPTLHKLVSKMWFSDEEYAKLIRDASGEAVQQSSVGDSGAATAVYNVACRWLHENEARWRQWSTGWNEKRFLTIAGLFSYDRHSNFTTVVEGAHRAVLLINSDLDFLRHSEYALRLETYNISCEIGVILKTYFTILAKAEETNLIGCVAALCPESMEALVELSNIRKKVIISPTIPSARFLIQQHYDYFFRTVPSMDEAKFILVNLLKRWNWRRITVFHSKGIMFDARIFQLNDIEITVLDEGKHESMSFAVAYSSLRNLKMSNSRIFLIEYSARGTYAILCAAYHHNMHLGAGYVWFLNPLLSEKWWVNVVEEATADSDHCTKEQMVNITAWTFTIVPEITSIWLLHSAFIRPIYQTNVPHVEPNATMNHGVHSQQQQQQENMLYRQRRSNTVPQTITADDSSAFSWTSRLKPARNLKYYYYGYVFDAVSVMGVAMLRLLGQNPSALSAFHQDASVAKAFRDLVASTGKDSIDDVLSSKRHSFFPPFYSDFYYQNQSSRPGFQSIRDFYGACLRFSDKNERLVDNWVLKERLLHSVFPLERWYRDTNCPLVFAQDVSSTLPPGPVVSSISSRFQAAEAVNSAEFNYINSDTLFPEVQKRYDLFHGSIKTQVLANVTWSYLNGPPSDGSIVNLTCPLPLYVIDALKMGCTEAIVFISVSVCAGVLFPFLTLALLYYRHKLREAERRVQRPLEELYRELADFDMPIEKIVINRCIGRGASGQVCGGEARKVDRWEAVAVKLLDQKTATLEKKIDFLREARLMSTLKHNNVVRLIGVSLQSLYLVMELMLLGDLKTYLLSRRTLAQRSPDHEDVRPSTLTRVATDIAQGLNYLHSRHLIHRDVACRNCLVGVDRVVKIGDFGLTRETGECNAAELYYRFTRKSELPVRWMAPEAVLYGISTIRSDVWSYGITLYEIITFGMFPYNEMANGEVVEHVSRKGFSVVECLPPSARNTTVWHLIHRCCQHQYKNRLSSMDHVLDVLTNNPECIRPFLTDPLIPKARIESVTPCQPKESSLSGFNICDTSTNLSLRTHTLGFNKLVATSPTAVLLVGQPESRLTNFYSYPEPSYDHHQQQQQNRFCSGSPDLRTYRDAAAEVSLSQHVMPATDQSPFIQSRHLGPSDGMVDSLGDPNHCGGDPKVPLLHNQQEKLLQTTLQSLKPLSSLDTYAILSPDKQQRISLTDKSCLVDETSKELPGKDLNHPPPPAGRCEDLPPAHQTAITRHLLFPEAPLVDFGSNCSDTEQGEATDSLTSQSWAREDQQLSTNTVTTFVDDDIGQLSRFSDQES